MKFDNELNSWAKAIGDHPVMQQMMLESAAKFAGKPIEELSVMERYGGSVKLSDFFDRIGLDR